MFCYLNRNKSGNIIKKLMVCQSQCTIFYIVQKVFSKLDILKMSKNEKGLRDLKNTYFLDPLLRECSRFHFSETKICEHIFFAPFSVLFFCCHILEQCLVKISKKKDTMIFL
jgi:hypothetical protein